MNNVHKIVQKKDDFHLAIVLEDDQADDDERGETIT